MKQVFWLFFALAVASVSSQSALAEDKDAADGQRYFAQYCASCHGKDGAGDGPVAKSLTKPPANLRLLGDKYGMPLPAPRIAKFIDGRDAVRAHGTRDMPVWGERLYALGHGEQGEVGIGEVVGKIIAYLNTIQDRRTASSSSLETLSAHQLTRDVGGFIASKESTKQPFNRRSSIERLIIANQAGDADKNLAQLPFPR